MVGGWRRYQSQDEDSSRWEGFPFRDGDIVISTRSKHGTTWMQMICALLVFQTPDLPKPLGTLSPWLDWLGEPRQDVVRRLEAQAHRRFIKTHTPLDGIPLDPRATYLCVGRHPLDAVVSLYHQGDNLDRQRVRELTGQALPSDTTSRPSLHEWLVSWIRGQPAATEALDSLPGVTHHLTDAWARRTDANVVLAHYHDLSSDLEGSMRGLARRLDIAVHAAAWPDMVRAARFDDMRSRADGLAPDTLGILKDRSRFFREGTSGTGRQQLGPDEYSAYLAAVGELAPAELLRWLHRP